jgi:hypothetical protein
MSANVSKIDVVLNAAEARQEAARVEQSMQGIAKSAQTAGVQASAGLSQVEAATAGTARSAAVLGKEIAANQRVMAQLRIAIAENRAEILGLTIAMKSLEDQGKKDSVEATNLAARMELLDIETKQLVTSFGLLNAETGQMQLQLKNIPPVLDDTAEKAAFTTRQTVQLSAAASRMTGAAIPGARAIGLLAGSFSLAAIPQFALIIGAGILIGKMLELAKAKDVHIELNDKLIAQDIVMAQTAETAAERTSKEKVVRGDMIAILSLLIDHSQKYTKALDDQKNAQIDLTFAQIRQDEAAVKFGDDMGNLWVPGVKGAGQEVARLTEEMQKNQAELDKNIASMVKFANETGKANDVVIRQAQEMGADAETIKRLSDALNSATRAQQQWQAALDEQTIPAVNLRNTLEGEAQARKQLIERIQGQVAAGKPLRDIVEANRSALEAELKAIEHGIDLDVAAGKVKGTHAAMQAELTRRVSEGHDGLEKYLAVVRATDEAHKHWTNSTDKAAAAAKAYAIAIAELEAKISTAKSARDEASGAITGFDQQEANVRTAIALKRKELNERLKMTLDQQRVVNSTLSELEAIQLATIGAKRAEAERQLAERLGQIEAAGYAKGSENKIAVLRAEISKRYDAEADFVKKAGFNEQRQSEYLLSVRLALEAEYMGRRKAIGDETRKHELAEEQKLQDAITDLELKQLREAARHAMDAQRAWNEARKFLFSQKQDASDAGIERFISQLKELGPAFADVDKNSQTMRTAIDFVRHAFDFSSKSAEMFQLKLDVLTGHSVSFGQTFKPSSLRCF